MDDVRAVQRLILTHIRKMRLEHAYLTKSLLFKVKYAVLGFLLAALLFLSVGCSKFREPVKEICSHKCMKQSVRTVQVCKGGGSAGSALIGSMWDRDWETQNSVFHFE